MNMHVAESVLSLKGKSLAIYLPDLAGGGTERTHINLAPHFLKAGMKVTFLLDRRAGELLDKVPEGAGIHVFAAKRQVAAISKLIRYLRENEVDFLISNMEHANVVAVWARRLAGVRTRVIVSQHCSLSDQVQRGGLKFKILPLLYRASLPRADAIVCVSQGVAHDIADSSGLDAAHMNVIYNGAATADIARIAAEPVEHPWFRLNEPLFVAAGRLVPQKDYPTLLRAFAHVARQRPARLLILGEGALRPELEALALELGIVDRVGMPGFIANPLPFMRRASAFVMSSTAEGFGNVLVEAMACGTPVVSTDCPHGPAEILDFGRFGRLAPSGDPEALAEAMLATIADPLPPEFLMARAASFSTQHCARNYLDLFSALTGKAKGAAHAPG